MSLPGDDCECCDPDCKAGHGTNMCSARTMTILYRIDMEDRSGTAFCEDCAADAMDSGLFSDGETEESDPLYAIFNRFEIVMPLECVEDCSHSGACDTDVSHWAPKLKAIESNAKIDPQAIRSELEEYGAWDADELSDDSTNWERIIWLAACNLKEERAD